VPEIVEIGERFIEGAVFVDGFFAASATPLIQEFVARYQARYHEMPDLIAAQAYDTIWMLAQILLDGAATRFHVREQLLRVQNLAGVSGMTTMRPNGDAGKELYLLSIQNGQIIQLN
jgi:ABC-type branched-subunit amino acid transport system substrate-binding protein